MIELNVSILDRMIPAALTALLRVSLLCVESRASLALCLRRVWGELRLRRNFARPRVDDGFH